MYAKIGIIGDVHAEHTHLERALEHLEHADVDIILCTGDLVDGRGDVGRCVELLQAHDVQVVRGNHDRWLLQERVRHVPNAHLRADLPQRTIAYLEQLPAEVHIDTPLGSLLLCHGVGTDDLRKVWPGTERMPPERSKRLDRLIDDGGVSFLINGHMHYRTLIHFEGLTLFNAGTLRGDHHPGFSILDLTDETLTGLEFTPCPQPVRTLPLGHQHASRVFRNTQEFDGGWTPLTLYAASS